jgi:hypothetical protein
MNVASMISSYFYKLKKLSIQAIRPNIPENISSGRAKRSTFEIKTMKSGKKAKEII